LRRLALAATVATALVAIVAQTAGASPGHSVAFSPNAHPFGQTYVRWAEDWGNWALGTPVDVNPFVNPDNCGPGPSSSKAWLLAGSFDGTVIASCTVPTGKGLLISPAGNFCSGATNGFTTQEELTDCALAGVTDITDVRVTVDGHRVKHITRYFLTTPVFGLDIQANNLFGVDAQTTPAVVVGEFVMVHPLRPGEHTIEGFVRSSLFPSGFAEIIYHVDVAPHGG
jgi:hypothetical protein